jgi:hypothetical protein
MAAAGDPRLDALAGCARAMSAVAQGQAAAARAREARSSAHRAQRRAALLRAFVMASLHRSGMIVRCAWCDRILVAGEYVHADDFLSGAIPKAISERRTTHSICPECLLEALTAVAADRATPAEAAAAPLAAEVAPLALE